MYTCVTNYNCNDNTKHTHTHQYGQSERVTAMMRITHRNTLLMYCEKDAKKMIQIQEVTHHTQNTAYALDNQISENIGKILCCVAARL